ncbi:MAG TPA: nucleotidyltransferase domain-containing protein [Catenuloplanes sp.]|jgi:hypothetical protein
MTVLLSGIVGSTAYGLAREGSDVDRLAVFVAPTIEIAGLDWHGSRETRVTTGPDSTTHEIGKYLKLALKGNPTITELLWLPTALYETLDADFGQRLIDLRGALLSEPAVRSAYGRYARQQAVRLSNRGDGPSPGDNRRRTAKYARHLLRLLRQGRELLATGELTVRVGDPADYFAFDRMTPDQMISVYDREDALFERTTSVLPAEPDVDRVRDFLADVRRAHLGAAGGTSDGRHWFSVRCLFGHGGGPTGHEERVGYEERVTMWRAVDFAEAVALAEGEALDYAADTGSRYLGLAQAYHLADEPEHGAEVYSLIRDSALAPDAYLDRFFDTGSQHQGGVGEPAPAPPASAGR